MRIPDNLRGVFGWIIAVDVSYDLGRLLLSLFCVPEVADFGSGVTDGVT